MRVGTTAIITKGGDAHMTDPDRQSRPDDDSERAEPVTPNDQDATASAPVPDPDPPLALSAEASEAAAQPGSPLPRFWEAIKRLPRYAKVAATLIADPDVPKRSKVALGVGGLYLVSPIDLVPGIIPVAGQLDDLYVLLRALRQALHSAPAEVSARHLHNVDLTMAHVEADIKVIEETTVWLVRRGVNAEGLAATERAGPEAPGLTTRGRAACATCPVRDPAW